MEYSILRFCYIKLIRVYRNPLAVGQFVNNGTKDYKANGKLKKKKRDVEKDKIDNRNAYISLLSRSRLTYQFLK